MSALLGSISEELLGSIGDGDIAAEIIASFHSSHLESHQRLCAAAAAVAQTLKDQSTAPTPVAYFAAAAAALAGVSRDPYHSQSENPKSSLLQFFALVLPRVPPAVVRRKWNFLADSLSNVLRVTELPEAAADAGLQCAAQLLILASTDNWDAVKVLFLDVLQFVTDPREKVRKQGHSALCEILKTFQNTQFKSVASKEITNLLERFLLLAGREQGQGRGANEVLYIFDALRSCLPLMTAEHINNILKICKPLLAMRKSIVTRRIMDILNAICIATSSVGSQCLLDLVCSVTSSVNDNEKSADWMAAVARVLRFGSKRVYDLDRQNCVAKLPFIFSSLGDILATEHEEAVFAATEGLKDLIYSCIDDILIKEGLEQIKVYRSVVRKCGPTAIEKICATMEGFVSYRYSAVWDMSFQIISAAFSKLGRSSSDLMVGIVRSLADIERIPDEDLSYRKQLHECIGVAIGAMGPEAFLSILPLNLEAREVSDVNDWLFPILKRHIVGASLSYFLKDIMRVVKSLEHQLEMGRKTISARSTEGLIYNLWSLLPSFCNYPVDTATSFRDLKMILCNTLLGNPDLRGIICSSLQILIRQNTANDTLDADVLPDEISSAEREAKVLYTSEVKKANLEAIKASASDFIDALREIYLFSKDNAGCLQETINAVASISEESLVMKYFRAAFKQLFDATIETQKLNQCKGSSSMQVDNTISEATLAIRRASLLDFSIPFLPRLNRDGFRVLLAAIKVSMQDKEGPIQKKAYKALSTVLKEKKEFMSMNLDELVELMMKHLPSYHISAKRHRLDCLYYIIVYILEDPTNHHKNDIIGSFLTEIVISLKESNKKTRNKAYELLVEIGHAYGDEERGGKREHLLQLFNMVAGGLAGETPHMISAAVTGLARLAYEFSDLINLAYSLLPSTFLLLRRKNRELAKANLGLIKVVVAKSRSDCLQDHLKAILEGLLNWQDETKNHFKLKVKLLIEMLVRKCGLDAVKAVMPQEHMKLLSNIRKTQERKERKAKSEDSESLHSKTTGISRQSRWNHTRIFSDFGEDDNSDEDFKGTTVSGQRSKLSYRNASKSSKLRSNRTLRRLNKSLTEDLLDQSEGDLIEDDPLDLLDLQKMRTALQSGHLKRKPDYSEPELDPEGRLIVREDSSSKQKQKGKQISSSDQEFSETRSVASTSQITQKKRRKTSASKVGWAYTGSEYTSKRAGGDVKKKDKLEPYAYWPLDRTLLNKREERRAVARKGMARVMKFAKKLEGRSASSALSTKGFKLKGKKRSKGKK